MSVDVKAIARKLPIRRMTGDQIITLAQSLVTEATLRAFENGHSEYAERLNEINEELFSVIDSVNVDEPRFVDLEKEKWDNYYRDNPVE